MTQNKWLKGDVVSGLALAALGAYIISEAWQWNYSGEDGPGPGFFPLWYGAVMVILSLVLVVQSVMRSGPGEPVNWNGVSRALAAWGAFAAAVFLLHPLGFLLSLALLTLFVVKVMYGRPLITALAVAAGNVAGFYLVFVIALDLGLPAGMLGF